MASGLNDHLESLREMSEELPEFSVKPFYEPECDSLILYVRSDQSYAKRLNSLLTLFLSTQDDSLVGCEVKGVQRLLRIAGDFGVLVHDRKIRLGILLAFALAEPPEDPAMGQYEASVKGFENIEIDRESLVPA
jgi:hypothetical protein